MIWRVLARTGPGLHRGDAGGEEAASCTGADGEQDECALTTCLALS